MDGIGSTESNLKEAISGENYEHTSMYPEFVKDAEADKNEKALTSFNYALAVEIEHEALYQGALDTLGKDGDSFEYYVCPICGHTHARSAPDKCPICNAAGSRFIKIS